MPIYLRISLVIFSPYLLTRGVYSLLGHKRQTQQIEQWGLRSSIYEGVTGMLWSQ
jgi:hypothetical protein